MKGFQIMADSFRRYLEQHPEEPNREYLEKQIKINDFLGECSQEDIVELYNSSAFNGITYAFCEKAMQNMGYSSKQILEVLNEIKWLHDTADIEKIIKN